MPVLERHGKSPVAIERCYRCRALSVGGKTCRSYRGPVPCTKCKRQRGTSRRGRLKRLERVFVATPQSKIQGTNIVLIDDVITTGATLEAAARMLKTAGAKRISAVVFVQA